MGGVRPLLRGSEGVLGGLVRLGRSSKGDDGKEQLAVV